MAWGGGRGQPRGHLARGGPVDCGRRPEVEGLLRAFFIVFTAEVIEACLVSALAEEQVTPLDAVSGTEWSGLLVVMRHVAQSIWRIRESY